MIPEPPSPAMRAALRLAAGADGKLGYAAFTATALYHPELGYYRRDRKRVGRSRDTDFYTASSFGETFASLVRSAAESWLGPAHPLSGYTLVEIGAEPGDSIFTGELSKFAGHRVFRIGEEPAIPDRSVVFANELFDAQPFVRLRFRDGGWRELGVDVSGDVLTETELAELSPDGAEVVKDLPVPWRDGHVVDASPASVRLMEKLLSGNWRGVAIFPDYGKTLPEMLENCPAGTARAYEKHTQSGDLLSSPGSRDLTFHVDWDTLSGAMCESGFTGVSVERQEAFFMRRASGELEKLFARAAGGNDPALMGRVRELIHPAHLGAKFQVLSGVRL